MTVDFSATGGTATAGTDYDEILPQPIAFGLKQSSVTVPVTIHDNGSTSGIQTVELLIGNPTGGAGLGSQTTATLSIVAGNPVLQFATTDFTAQESSSKGIVTVKRFGPRSDVVTVHYKTDATAPPFPASTTTTSRGT